MLLGAAAGLVVLAVAAGVVLAGSPGRIAAGVSIQGVNVGGLTAEEAQAKLEATAARYSDKPVLFTADEERFSIRPEALDVRVDWAAAAEAAVERSDAPFPLRGLKRVWLRLGGAEVQPEATAFRAALSDRIERMAAKVDRVPSQAALVLAGREPEIVPAVAGRELDRTAAGALVVAALAGFEREPTALPVAVSAPEVTSDTLAPVARQLRTVLSAPVRLTHSGAVFSVDPQEMIGLLQLPADGATRLRIEPEAAAARFENLGRGLARPPRNADFAVRPNGRVRIVPSRPGRELNVAATSAALLQAASRVDDRTAAVVVARFDPRMTTAQARALRVERQLASYATLYAGTADRINNLQLAIDTLDGARIAPGTTWSFNEFVGPRTAERGYRSAPVIMDGKYEEGIGGGVSQVATTVFNAAWEAGIKIAERHAHALYISRYPDGRDATVNYPDVDLKLVNDTPRWIVIKAAYDESGILVRLLGGGPERRVESIAEELKVTGRPKTEREPDPAMFEGERIVDFAGEPSREIRVERIIYQAGEVIARETWYTHYRYEARIVRYGTKPRPQPTAPPPAETTPRQETTPPTTTGPGPSGGGR
ncbi:MAG TPA: VanW family protein [Gaiellaceae bacterium]|nr:VanW family protein [Gaiellaceae bacterium]